MAEPELDLDALSEDVSAMVEAAMAGHDIRLVRSGQQIGVLEFRPHVLEGTVLDGHGRHDPPEPAPEGVTVVATAMKLSDAARRRLSDQFGADYIVLDLHRAPATTDVLLVPPVSAQLLGMLRQRFPDARIVVTEIEDDELGVSYLGPVSRMLDAGANAYLPARPIAELAADVHAYLTRDGTTMLEAGRATSRELSGRRPEPD